MCRIFSSMVSYVHLCEVQGSCGSAGLQAMRLLWQTALRKEEVAEVIHVAWNLLGSQYERELAKKTGHDSGLWDRWEECSPTYIRARLRPRGDAPKPLLHGLGTPPGGSKQGFPTLLLPTPQAKVMLVKPFLSPQNLVSTITI